MRNLRIESLFFAAVLVTVISCQKEVLVPGTIQEDSVKINSFEPIILTAHSQKEVRDEEGIILATHADATNFRDTVDAKVIIPGFIKITQDEAEKLKFLEEEIALHPDEPITQEDICNLKTEQAYETALQKANRTCQVVYAEVICNLDGMKVAALLQVYPTFDCMTPIDDDSDPKE